MTIAERKDYKTYLAKLSEADREAEAREYRRKIREAETHLAELREYAILAAEAAGLAYARQRVITEFQSTRPRGARHPGQIGEANDAL